MSGPARRPPRLLVLASAAVAVCMVVRLGYLLVRAWGAPDPLGQLLSARVARLAWTTVRLAAAVTALTVAVGVAMAWLLERTDVPGRGVLGLAAVLPLVMPTYVAALALVSALGPRGLAWEVPGLVGFWGLTAALALSTYPYVLLPVRAVLRSTDPALEEAARALGDSPRAAFGRVLLPQLRPAATAGGLLVFLYVLSDFGAVSIMRVDTLTRGIFSEYRASFDRARPALLGLVLVALTLAAIAAEQRLRGRPAPARAGTGSAPPPTTGLGRWRWPAAAAVAAVPCAGVGLPVAVLAYWSTVGSGREVGAELVRAGVTSVQVSLAAAVVAVVAALPVAVLAVRHRSRLSRALEALSVSGYALPGLVIALALVFLGARFLPVLYQTLTLVVVAYVVRFMPEALGAVRSSLHLVDPSLEEVGRTLGRTRLGVARTVTFPLVRGGMLGGGALVFLTAMKELPATLLLQPAGRETVATQLWTDASQGLYAQAAPAALVLVLVSAALLWPLQTRWPHHRLPAGLAGAAAE